jgi:hypothetical protein
MLRLPLLTIVLTLLLLSGCAEVSNAHESEPNRSSNLNTSLLQPGPCGSLLIKRPFFNVTFHQANTTVIGGGYIHILPNRTQEAAMYAVQECAWITRVVLSEGPNTTLALPAGYFVFAYINWTGTSVALVPTPYVKHLADGVTGERRWTTFAVGR